MPVIDWDMIFLFWIHVGSCCINDLSSIKAWCIFLLNFFSKTFVICDQFDLYFIWWRRSKDSYTYIHTKFNLSSIVVRRIMMGFSGWNILPEITYKTQNFLKFLGNITRVDLECRLMQLYHSNGVQIYNWHVFFF